MSRSPTRTVDEITVRASPSAVFTAAADIERWPRILPHYRWVKIVTRQGRTREVEMAARRGRIPVRWRALQTLFPGEQRIHYRHTGGLTRGMEVEWRLERGPDGVRVTIVHELSLDVPIVRSALGRWIVARVFVSHIAGQTLRCLKELLEERTGAATPAGSAT